MPAVPEHTTVAVVGAGPTGLLLAGDLAGAGLDVTLLEQHTERSPLTRAFVVHARTLEVLDARGLADELIATGTTLDHLRLFGGGQLDLSWLPSRFPFLLVTPQYNVERLLEERARKAGVRLIRGAKVVGLRQHDDRVELDVRTPGGTSTLNAGHVVGADGAHSTVRDALGLPFPGHKAVSSIMLADVRLTNPPAEPLTANAVGDAFAFLAPFGDGWWRVFAWNRHNQLPDTAPVDFDEVREVTHRALGTDLGLTEARWLSRFHSDERQVPQYHIGRVLLAGDAAHVHSPAGGQGMNTGLQDAANLSWKLAATVRGWAPDGLLDTYQAERHPVGKLVLRASGTIIRLALMHHGLAKARNAVTGAALHLSPLAHRASGTLSGIGIDYPHAPRAADVDLTGGGRLYPLLGGARFVLLAGAAAAGDAAAATDGRTSRVVTATPVTDDGSACTLVRPDGYVAWSGNVADVPGALERHLGTRAAH